MTGLRSSSSRPLTVRLSVLGLALAIWFQGCKCDVWEVPDLTAIAPNSGEAGSTLATVVLTGSGFVTGGTDVIIAGTGVTESKAAATNTTSLFTNLTIASTAMPGVYKVKVRTPGGESPEIDFTVVAPMPALSRTEPNSVRTGAAPLSANATLTGSGLLGATSVNVTGGITTSNLSVLSATQLTVTLTVPLTAVGVQAVTVTTPVGSSDGIDFVVDGSPPTLISITPSTSASGGSPFTATIVGTNFDATAAVVVAAGSGIQISNLNVASTTQLTASLLIPASTPPGSYNIAVRTQFGTSNPLPLPVTAPAPVLTCWYQTAARRGAASLSDSSAPISLPPGTW